MYGAKTGGAETLSAGFPQIYITLISHNPLSTDRGHLMAGPGRITHRTK